MSPITKVVIGVTVALLLLVTILLGIGWPVFSDLLEKVTAPPHCHLVRAEVSEFKLSGSRFHLKLDHEFECKIRQNHRAIEVTGFDVSLGHKDKYLLTTLTGQTEFETFTVPRNVTSFTVTGSTLIDDDKISMRMGGDVVRGKLPLEAEVHVKYFPRPFKIHQQESNRQCHLDVVFPNGDKSSADSIKVGGIEACSFKADDNRDVKPFIYA